MGPSGWTRRAGRIIGLLGLGFVVLTFLPLIRTDAWWIRIFDFVRLQAMIALALAVAGYLALARLRSVRTWTMAAAMAAAIGYNAWQLLPYAGPLDEAAVEQSPFAQAFLEHVVFERGSRP